MRKLLLAGVAGILSVTGVYAAPITCNTIITNGGFTFSDFSCSVRCRPGPAATLYPMVAGTILAKVAGAAITVARAVTSFAG